VHGSAAALDTWHRDGRAGSHPAPAWQHWLTALLYATLLDLDGRPPGMKLRWTF